MTLETPYKYQQEGARWLAGQDQALLADEMGLGKSAQVILACDLVGARNILIVSPASVRINWDREFHRFSPMDRLSRIIATGKDAPGPGVNIISYDLLAGAEKLRAALKARRWDVLVIDEAHYIKERSAKRTKAVYGHAKHPGLMHAADRCWRLTATPAPNNASELYTHLKSMGVETRPYWDFVFDFCAGFDADYGYKITGHKNTEKLKAMMAPKMLRRRKFEIDEHQLPPIVFHNVTVERGPVELDPYFLENYQGIGIPAFLKRLESLDTNLKNTLRDIFNDGFARNNDVVKVLEGSGKTLATLRRYIGLAKLQSCLDIVEEELATGQINKIVLFAVHQQVIEDTRQRLRKYGAVTLFGGTPADKRQRHIDRFQNDPSCRVFVGQIVAAGVGITLTAASEVAFLESSWVPAENAQAAMRCHRIGQQHKVRVRHFICAGSVDEDVMRVVTQKTREIVKIID